MLSRAARVSGALLLLASVPATPSAAAQEAEPFGGYEIVASGVGLTVAPSVPAVLPVETPVEGTLSLALASLSTGGLGYGQASSVFPGTPIVGLRPLLETGAGVELPIPDYPIVVESREHQNTQTSRIPGITMSSNVDPDAATVTADLGGFTLPGILDVGSIRTVSTSLVEPARGVATSETEVTGVDLLGGVLHIDSIETSASAETDAVAGNCGGRTTVSGATINGSPVRIDGEGIHADGQALPLGIDPNEVLLQVLENTGLEIRVLGGSGPCDGPDASRTTSGVLVSIPLPAVAAVPPGGRLDLILGSASARATATPAFEFEPPPVADTEPPAVDDVVTRVPGPSSGGAGLSPVEVVPESPPPTRSSPEVVETASPEPIAYSFGGVPATLAAGLMLLAIPGSRRIRRYLDRLLAMAAPP